MIIFTSKATDFLQTENSTMLKKLKEVIKSKTRPYAWHGRERIQLPVIEAASKTIAIRRVTAVITTPEVYTAVAPVPVIWHNNSPCAIKDSIVLSV